MERLIDSRPPDASRSNAFAPFSKFLVGAALETTTAASSPAATSRTRPTA